MLKNTHFYAIIITYLGVFFVNLNRHQKEIISKILSKDIYDITSYLNYFNLWHVEKYDMEKLEKEFLKSENGKQYKVMKEGHSTTKVVNKTINTPMAPMSFPQVFPRTDISDDEWEYKEAKFVPHTKPIEYEFEEEKFTFDFDTGVNIINDFNNLIDFFTLWNYLKQISATDIGLFFEPTTLHKKEKGSIIIKRDYVELPKDSKIGELLDKFPNDIFDRVPTHTAIEFTDKTWKINEENLTMSKEFIGKKFIPSSSLRIYSKRGYKTKEEIAQRNNLIVAWIAVIISIISILASSLLDKTPKQLNSITEQLEEIKSITNQIENEDIQKIKTSIENIEEMVDTLSTDDNTLDEIKEEIIEIKKSLLN